MEDHLRLVHRRRRHHHAAGQGHGGHGLVRIQQWDGAHWKYASDWIEPHHDLLDPIYKESALAYAKEKNITPRDCSKPQS